MIDFFNITIDGDDFPEIGKVLTTRQPSGVETNSLTAVKVRSASGAPDFKVQVETLRKQPRMRFSGSPAKWLQGHNGMGSNDFQAMVKASVLLVFETLEIDCPASISSALSSGAYDVHEAHVAEHYRLPRGLIPKLCDNIRRHADSSLKAVPMEKGIGIRLWPDSRDLTVAIYDKYNYFLDRLCRHKFALMGNMPADFQRIGVGMNFDQMLEEYLANVVRIETRHMRSLNSKLHPLNRGSLWLPESARELHVNAVQKIPLQDIPPLDQRELLLDTASLEHRTLIALWLDGRDPMKFCASEPTYYRRRKEILRLYGIDLSVRPLPENTVKWSDLTNPASIVEPPQWAVENGFMYDPVERSTWAVKTQNEAAWLRPAPQHRLFKSY